MSGAQKPARGKFKTYHPEQFKGLLTSLGYFPRKDFAHAIGMNEFTFAGRLRGETPWRYKELCAIWRKTKGHITADDFMKIFFDVTQDDILGIW